jgi:hypothetical protein
MEGQVPSRTSIATLAARHRSRNNGDGGDQGWFTQPLDGSYLVEMTGAMAAAAAEINNPDARACRLDGCMSAADVTAWFRDTTAYFGTLVRTALFFNKMSTHDAHEMNLSRWGSFAVAHAFDNDAPPERQFRKSTDTIKQESAQQWEALRRCLERFRNAMVSHMTLFMFERVMTTDTHAHVEGRLVQHFHEVVPTAELRHLLYILQVLREDSSMRSTYSTINSDTRRHRLALAAIRREGTGFVGTNGKGKDKACSPYQLQMAFLRAQTHDLQAAVGDFSWTSLPGAARGSLRAAARPSSPRLHEVADAKAGDLEVDYGEDDDDDDAESGSGGGGASGDTQELNVYTEAEVDNIVAGVQKQMTQRYVMGYHLGGAITPSLRRAWASNPVYKFFDRDTGLVNLDADLDQPMQPQHLLALDWAAYDGRDTHGRDNNRGGAAAAASTTRPTQVKVVLTGSHGGAAGSYSNHGGGRPDKKRGRPDHHASAAVHHGTPADRSSHTRGSDHRAVPGRRPDGRAPPAGQPSRPPVCWHCDAVPGAKEPKPLEQRAGHNTRRCPHLKECPTCGFKHTPGHCAKPPVGRPRANQ